MQSKFPAARATEWLRAGQGGGTHDVDSMDFSLVSAL